MEDSGQHYEFAEEYSHISLEHRWNGQLTYCQGDVTKAPTSEGYMITLVDDINQGYTESVNANT